ncbi:NADH-quinone oxidoreductase subunit K 2 [Geomonas silvestris]|uniref:NADH-quinone oxidoreductase subunit K n=1 Tax=Geomonas silvestris TaxID=2740184 RepID=A0A6V8MGW7_9BACT|nr:NADH-quinone oxidoreductase subunit NuoK [Geomonas silvestris]GFO58929.1 NADH-quinone oxidoreductase subunit K 2 [Geomonas silvestris]
MTIPLFHVLILAALLFAMGLACTIAWRANVIMMLIGIEIMLNAVMLTLVGGSSQWGMADGQIFSLMLMALTSSEVSLALAMVVYLHRRRQSVDTDDFNSMKG